MEEGERRRGSVRSLSVFSLGIFRPFLGLFHGFLSSMISIFARLLIERPPGVPFQKIQFGNERGGRSVLSRLPELRIARILALLRCLILRLSVCHKEICLLGKNPKKNEFLGKNPKKNEFLLAS